SSCGESGPAERVTGTQSVVLDPRSQSGAAVISTDDIYRTAGVPGDCLDGVDCSRDAGPEPGAGQVCLGRIPERQQPVPEPDYGGGASHRVYRVLAGPGDAVDSEEGGLERVIELWSMPHRVGYASRNTRRVHPCTLRKNIHAFEGFGRRNPPGAPPAFEVNSMSKPHLELTGVEMAVDTPKGPFIALDNLNLKIHEVEFVLLIGHSGCGKSTVLNIVAGLLDASRGGCVLDAHEVKSPGPLRAVVFQKHALLPCFTVYENVELAVRRVFRKSLTRQEPKEC